MGKVAEFADRLKPEEWQAEAYKHVEQIGELGYVHELFANTLAKGRLVVVEEDESGAAVEPEKDADGRTVFTDNREKAQRVLRPSEAPTATTGPFSPAPPNTTKRSASTCFSVNRCLTTRGCRGKSCPSSKSPGTIIRRPCVGNGQRQPKGSCR